MNSYRDIAQNMELDSINSCNQTIAQIFDEMDEIIGIKTLMARLNANPASFMRLILIDPSFVEFRPMLLSLLDKHNVNYYALLWNYTNAFARAPIGVVNIMVDELNKSHIWNPLFYYNNLLTVGTARGDFKLMNVDRWLMENKGVILAADEYNNHCHEGVWNLAPYFEDYTASVVRMPTVVGGGSFFHSFFEKDGVVLDFATKAAIINDSFSAVMRPQKIFSCPAGELDDRYEELRNTDPDVPDSMCAVLALAINEIKKGR